MSESEREDAVERGIRHYPSPLVDARELTDAVLEETDAFDDLADPRREILDCLRVLRRSGEVISHSPGANAITWAHVDRVVRDPPPRTPADHPDQADLESASGPEREHTPASGGPHAPEHNAPTHAVESPDASLEDALAEWRPGRNATERRERRAAGVRVLKWARERPGEDLARSDVVPALYDELALDDQTEQTWWTQIARPALQHAADAGLVELDGRRYRWVADETES